MGDGDDGAPGHQPFERRANFFFRFAVERGRGLVENEQRRVLQEGAGDGDALALAPESLTPRSPTIVSRPSVRFSMKGRQRAAVAADQISSSLASGRP